MTSTNFCYTNIKVKTCLFKGLRDMLISSQRSEHRELQMYVMKDFVLWCICVTLQQPGMLLS